MLHGGMELTHDLWGYVIDDANAADLPAQIRQFLRQPIGIGVEHTAAQNLAPHCDELYPSQPGLGDAHTPTPPWLCLRHLICEKSLEDL